MNIVKMHNKQQQEFDAFLKQQLDSTPVDAANADKYFAEMQLPLKLDDAPVAAQNKVLKKWLLFIVFLLTAIATLTYIWYDDKAEKSTAIQHKNEKGDTKQENVTLINSASKTAAAELNSQKPARKLPDNSIAQKQVLLQQINAAVGTTPKNMTAAFKNNNLPVNSSINKVVTSLPDSSLSIKKPTIIQSDITKEKQQQTTDSVYIIW